MIRWSGRLSKNFSQEEYHAGSGTVYFYAETDTFLRCIQAFRRWLGKPMYVVSWYRTREENMKVGGIPSSNHLTGTALDWHLANHIITEAEFKAYCRKWAQICKEVGPCIGEAGLYTWGIHFGMQNPTQAKVNGRKFYHWDSRSGKQINLPFKDLYNI
jgi:hypothetical protein